MRCLRCDKESETMDLCSHCGVSLKDQVQDIIKDLTKEETQKKHLIKSLATTKDLRAVKPIVDVAMGEDESECRIEAIKALAKLGDRDVLPYLVELLVKDKASEIRVAAAEAIGELKGHKATESLSNALNDHVPEVKIAVIKTLRELGSQDSIKLITRMLTGQDPRVERTAFQAIQAMGYQVIYDGERVSKVRPVSSSKGTGFIVPLVFLIILIAGGLFLYKKLGNPEKRYVTGMKDVVIASQAAGEELFELTKKLESSGLDPTVLDAINVKSGSMESKFRSLRAKLKDLKPPEQYTAMHKEAEEVLDGYVAQSRSMVSSGLYSDFAGHLKELYGGVEQGQSKLTGIKKELTEAELKL